MGNEEPIRCLILACGNALRGDDGVGLLLAAWAEARFRNEPGVRVIARQQWTPELAEDVSRADAVLFVDSSAACRPGAIQIAHVRPAEMISGISTHHFDASRLLGLCRGIYEQTPRNALLLTVGMDSSELGEKLSDSVEGALPLARAAIEMTVKRLLRAAEMRGS